MKLSKAFIHTTKEIPKDASIISHKLLIQSGFITQTSSGLYDLGYLGKRVFDNIKNIIKTHLDKAGLCEVSLSCVSDYSLWQKSGRSEIMGAEMLKFKDRKNATFVLSPTNEEAMLNLASKHIKSYKNLPVNLYQINIKFRDEARPRFGLLRAREFVMKDAYSFHSSQDCLQKEFDKMRKVYSDIFNDLGIKYKIVQANSGAIGGSGSEEFIALCDNGEDTIVTCDSCDYGANIESAIRANAKLEHKNTTKPQELIHTPDIKTIKQLEEFFATPAKYFIKAVIKKAFFIDEADGSKKSKIVVFFIRGDDELEDVKALSFLKAVEIFDASDADIKAHNLQAGFCGVPLSTSDDVFKTNNVEYYFDDSLKGGAGLICGANKQDYHISNVSLNHIPNELFSSFIKVKEGDICCCGGTLSYSKGIEIAHIFKLGDKYSKASNISFLNQNQQNQYFIMGCYGIGVSRLIATLIEQNNDEGGMIWQKGISPFDVCIILSNTKDEQITTYGATLYNKLQDIGISVLLDDRDKASYGFKMKDYELMGFSFGVVVGKGLANNEVELIIRDGMRKQNIKTQDIINTLHNLIFDSK